MPIIMDYSYLLAVREIFLTEVVARTNDKVIHGVRTCTIEIAIDSLYMGTCLYRTNKLQCTAFRNVFVFVDVDVDRDRRSRGSGGSRVSAAYFYGSQSIIKRQIKLYRTTY